MCGAGAVNRGLHTDPSKSPPRATRHTAKVHTFGRGARGNDSVSSRPRDRGGAEGPGEATGDPSRRAVPVVPPVCLEFSTRGRRPDSGRPVRRVGLVRLLCTVLERIDVPVASAHGSAPRNPRPFRRRARPSAHTSTVPCTRRERRGCRRGLCRPLTASPPVVRVAPVAFGVKRRQNQFGWVLVAFGW